MWSWKFSQQGHIPHTTDSCEHINNAPLFVCQFYLHPKIGGTDSFTHLLITNLQTNYKELAPLTNVLILPPQHRSISYYNEDNSLFSHKNNWISPQAHHTSFLHCLRLLNHMWKLPTFQHQGKMKQSIFYTSLTISQGFHLWIVQDRACRHAILGTKLYTPPSKLTHRNFNPYHVSSHSHWDFTHVC